MPHDDITGATFLGMIIESGHDLRLVLGTAEHQLERKSICIVALDEELRLITIVELSPDSDEPGILDSVPAIAAALFDETPEARYLALAWSTDREMGRDVGWLRSLDERIRGDGLLEPVRLLGQIVFAADGTSITVPPCDFTLYPELRDLPRSVSIPGPHGDSCTCPLCVRDRRFFEAEYSDLMYPEPYPEEYGADSGSGSGSGSGEYGYPTARERQAPSFHARRPSLFTAPGAAPVAGPHVDDTPHFDPFWNRWYPAPERSYKRWTREEEVALQRAHADGMSCFDISILLRRQPGAIASRLNRLGLSARTVVPGEDLLPDPNEVVEMPETRRPAVARERPTLFDD